LDVGRSGLLFVDAHQEEIDGLISGTGWPCGPQFNAGRGPLACAEQSDTLAVEPEACEGFCVQGVLQCENLEHVLRRVGGEVALEEINRSAFYGVPPKEPGSSADEDARAVNHIGAGQALGPFSGLSCDAGGLFLRWTKGCEQDLAGTHPDTYIQILTEFNGAFLTDVLDASADGEGGVQGRFRVFLNAVRGAKDGAEAFAARAVGTAPMGGCGFLVEEKEAV